METINYQQQATDFLKKYGIKYSAKFIKYGLHFAEDEECRDIYRCTLSRMGKQISFRFGQSLNNTGKNIAPTAYDLLTCIEKYDVEDFDYWCREFGFDERPLSDYSKVRKIYDSVVKESQKVQSFFNSEELEELREIQ